MTANFFETYPLAVTGEILRILPDSVIIISGLMALLTSSFPMAVFFLSLLEAIAGFHVFRKTLNMLDITFVKPSDQLFTAKCQTGFQSATLQSFFGSPDVTNAIISPPLYILSTAATYLFMGLNAQMQELEALGPDYSSRYYISVFALCVFLFVLGVYRLHSGCEGIATVILSIAVGLALGALLIYQNRAILGPESINMLSIPLLKNRAVTGEKLYVCSPS
jgi:hypothetical protein